MRIRELKSSFLSALSRLFSKPWFCYDRYCFLKAERSAVCTSSSSSNGGFFTLWLIRYSEYKGSVSVAMELVIRFGPPRRLLFFGALEFIYYLYPTITGI